MSTRISEPFSLEDQCLLRIICHLEEYLPEILASLPLHFRHRLLLNLPAADICQLENTPVSAGIDMEGMVWKPLAEILQVEHYYKHTPCYMCYKSEYLNQATTCILMHSICMHILNGRLDNAKVLLFSVKRCLGLSNWEGIQHSFTRFGKGYNIEYPTPCRYARHFAKDFQKMDLLSCVVERYQWLPVKLVIDWFSFCKSKTRGDLATQSLLRKLLSRVEMLDLGRASKVAATFILEQLFSNPQVYLNELRIRFHDDDAIAFVSMFSQPNKSVYPQSNLPYSGLTSITFSNLYGRTQEVSTYMQAIIKYQKSLTTVKFCHFDTLSLPLVNMAASLFYQPQFREMEFHNLGFNGEHLSCLIPQFLAAPSEDHEKVLILHRVDIEHDCIDFAVPISTGTTPSAPPHKALGLTQTLSPEIPILPGVTTLQHLHFNRVTLKQQPSPSAFFSNLFQSPHLKLVIIDKCAIVADGLLPALTQGLYRQMSVGSLEELRFTRNDLAASLESELREFFDVIFSLPQFAKLKLNLGQNSLENRHFSIMHDSWKCNADQTGKRLKQLDLVRVSSRVDIRDHDVSGNNEFTGQEQELLEIAEGGDFVPLETR